MDPSRLPGLWSALSVLAVQGGTRELICNLKGQLLGTREKILASALGAVKDEVQAILGPPRMFEAIASSGILNNGHLNIPSPWCTARCLVGIAHVPSSTTEAQG